MYVRSLFDVRVYAVSVRTYLSDLCVWACMSGELGTIIVSAIIVNAIMVSALYIYAYIHNMCIYICTYIRSIESMICKLIHYISLYYVCTSLSLCVCVYIYIYVSSQTT